MPQRGKSNSADSDSIKVASASSTDSRWSAVRALAKAMNLSSMVIWLRDHIMDLRGGKGGGWRYRFGVIAGLRGQIFLREGAKARRRKEDWVIAPVTVIPTFVGRRVSERLGLFNRSL